jgi:hypothetical protein
MIQVSQRTFRNNEKRISVGKADFADSQCFLMDRRDLLMSNDSPIPVSHSHQSRLAAEMSAKPFCDLLPTIVRLDLIFPNRDRPPGLDRILHT